MNIFSTSIQALEKGIQYSGAKHKAISHNIANVDTPNFKRKDIKPNFAETFRRELESHKTDVRHKDFGGTSNLPYRAD